MRDLNARHNTQLGERVTLGRARELYARVPARVKALYAQATEEQRQQRTIDEPPVIFEIAIDTQPERQDKFYLVSGYADEPATNETVARFYARPCKHVTIDPTAL